MTYQVTMLGADGVVMASDRRQLVTPYVRGDVAIGIAIGNDFNKITVAGRRFAWAFAGDRPSFMASQHLAKALVKPISDAKVQEVLQDCCNRGAKLRTSTMTNSIVFADGKNRHIQHVVFEDDGIARVGHPIQNGILFTGQSTNRASALAAQYYSPDMTVSQLARLAAYSVVTAGQVDNLFIGGLDVFAYRDSTRKFEELLLSDMKKEAADLDTGIRKLIRSTPR